MAKVFQFPTGLDVTVLSDLERAAGHLESIGISKKAADFTIKEMEEYFKLLLSFKFTGKPKDFEVALQEFCRQLTRERTEATLRYAASIGIKVLK